jgi:hypothetical protein
MGSYILVTAILAGKLGTDHDFQNIAPSHHSGKFEGLIRNPFPEFVGIEKSMGLQKILIGPCFARQLYLPGFRIFASQNPEWHQV